MQVTCMSQYFEGLRCQIDNLRIQEIRESFNEYKTRMIIIDNYSFNRINDTVNLFEKKCIAKLDKNRTISATCETDLYKQLFTDTILFHRGALIIVYGIHFIFINGLILNMGDKLTREILYIVKVLEIHKILNNVEPNRIYEFNLNDHYYTKDTLHFGLSKIRDLEPGCFFSNLSSLFITSNLITRLDINTFNNLDSLINLSLGGNRIETIETGAFNGLTKLKYLDLSCNFLTFITADMFTPLTTLETLSLKSNIIIYIDMLSFETCFSQTVLQNSIDLSMNPWIFAMYEKFKHVYHENFITDVFIPQCRHVEFSF